MPKPIYESIAIGGPLHGVKLAGPATWDGKIPLPSKRGDNQVVRFHSGNYRWQEGDGWFWVDSIGTYCSYGDHRFKRFVRRGEWCLCGMVKSK